MSEAAAFTDGWDKAEWKFQRRLAKGHLHAEQQPSKHRPELEQEQKKRQPQLQAVPRDHLPFSQLDQKRLEKHQRIAHNIAASLLQQQLVKVPPLVLVAHHSTIYPYTVQLPHFTLHQQQQHLSIATANSISPNKASPLTPRSASGAIRNSPRSPGNTHAARQLPQGNARARTSTQMSPLSSALSDISMSSPSPVSSSRSRRSSGREWAAGGNST